MVPHLPHGDQTSTASTTKAKDWGTLQGPLNPEEDMEVPGTRRQVGGQAHPREPTSNA